jgi:acetoin:2,6-dichlorophenolindophenol oxidoreductase subunit beta
MELKKNWGFKVRHNEAINLALEKIIHKNSDVYLLGEDLLDPYGGAFKVTKGLSSKFPENIIPTPISEASFVGMATGMAMTSLRPVVEIMFGDFLSLAFDQILNHASKFEAMYDGQVKVPMVIRTPMGGGRGYGPTHSQCIEKYFFGMPGLKVLAPNLYHDMYSFYSNAILAEEQPVLVIEQKLLYPELMSLPNKGMVEDFLVSMKNEDDLYPTISISVVPAEDCKVTLLAYGQAAELAKRALWTLMMDYEIGCELLIPTQLYPFDYHYVIQSVLKTGRLVIAEEGTLSHGFGAEISAEMQKNCFKDMKAPVFRVASKNSIIPNSKALEAETLISEEDIVMHVLKSIEY